MSDLNITPQELVERLKQPAPPRLLDIRLPEERAVVQLPDSQLIDGELVQAILDTWPRDTPIVCYCHHGIRSLEAAMYFKKTDCFCFKRQLLKSGEEKDMPVVFVVDRDLPAGIDNIVLTYTFLRADKYASQDQKVTN